MKTVWWLLKTFLFSTIMVSDGVLGSVVFAKPHSRNNQDMLGSTARSLAETVLRTLYHISFVVSQFGGVIATAASEDPGFIELRKVFYLAVDVLSSSEPPHEHETIEVCERFVKELIDNFGRCSGMCPFAFFCRPCLNDLTDHVDPSKQAKTTYALACIEQLVPLLSEQCLRDHVWDLCAPWVHFAFRSRNHMLFSIFFFFHALCLRIFYHGTDSMIIRYLTDPSYRETFESAHSVMLAICASHTQQQHPQRPSLPQSTKHRITVAAPDTQQHNQVLDGGPETPDLFGFVPRMVPFYAQCLIEASWRRFTRNNSLVNLFSFSLAEF
jgi:hypothetical protein